MIDFTTCNEAELWEFVAAYLKKNGIDTVLVGGGVVCVYTRGVYRSGDLDMIVYSNSAKSIDDTMNEIEFFRNGKNFYREDCKFAIEFPSGPIGIGEETSIRPVEREAYNQIIRILSPTDSVKDRLASYIYFNSRDCFEQAVLVAKMTEVNLGKVEIWLQKEKNGESVWKEFLEALK